MNRIMLVLSLLTTLAIKSYSQGTEEGAVKKVLQEYKSAIEKLSTSGVVDLFVANSEVIESGKIEGTIAAYLDHHLGPELKEFKSFKFSNYTAKVEVDGNYAFATEEYVYTIVLKDGKEIKQKGVATSVLQKTEQGWKIKSTHSSARRSK